MLTFLLISASPFLRSIFSVSYPLFPSLHSFRGKNKKGDFNSVCTRSSQGRLPLVLQGARRFIPRNSLLVTRPSFLVFHLSSLLPIQRLFVFSIDNKKCTKIPLSLLFCFLFLVSGYSSLICSSICFQISNPSKITRESAMFSHLFLKDESQSGIFIIPFVFFFRYRITHAFRTLTWYIS